MRGEGSGLIAELPIEGGRHCDFPSSSCMRTCRRIVLHGILATGEKAADADVLESRRALSSGCSRHMIIRMPCDRPDGSSRSVVWETSLRGGACRAHGGGSAQVWETSSVAGLAAPIAGQGSPRLRLPRNHRGPGNTFPRRALTRAVLSAGGGCPGVRVLRGPGFGRKAREEWVMFRALLRRWCRWAASLQWIRVRCRTDEFRVLGPLLREGGGDVLPLG